MILTYDPTKSIAGSVNDIIQELNSQYTSTFNKAALPVAAYNTVTITLPTPAYTKDVPIFSHNLGFPPLYLLFLGSLKVGGIGSMPVADAEILAFFQYNGSVTSYTTTTTIYVRWIDLAESDIQEFTYIVFNVPINPT